MNQPYRETCHRREPLMPKIHKTPKRQPRSEKSQTDPPVSNKSGSINDNRQRTEINRKARIKETNTIFRQNGKKLGIENVSFTLSKNNWRSDEGNKNAIAYFSETSKQLVVIPKIIVDKYIFDPFFKKIQKGLIFHLTMRLLQ